MKDKIPNIVINVDRIKEIGITITETIHLYKLKDNSILYNEFINYKRLENLNLIKIINDEGTEKYVIRTLGEKLLDEMITQQKEVIKTSKKVSKRHVSKEVEEHVQEYREKWRGLSLGMMGSPKSCKEKLTRWMHENPEYTMQNILKAADIYIKTFNGEYKYLQQADYFIFKKTGREESSRLSAFIEEIEVKQFEEGWSSSLK